MTVIALCSGGLDSVTLAYGLRYADPSEELVLVSFDYGQKHLNELAYAAVAAKRLRAAHAIIKLPPLRGSALTDAHRPVPEGHYEDPSMLATVVPNRNMIMLAHAISLAVVIRARRVAVAVHAGDAAIYPDCRPGFLQAMLDAAIAGNEGFIDPDFGITAPFLSANKTGIAKEAERLNVPHSETWSCYVGGDLHCGRCGACVERKEAYDKGYILDPTEYAA